MLTPIIWLPLLLTSPVGETPPAAMKLRATVVRNAVALNRYLPSPRQSGLCSEPWCPSKTLPVRKNLVKRRFAIGTAHMGWVWRDEPRDADSLAGDVASFENPNLRSSGDRCSTRKVVKSQCKTEEVGAGKFVRKCERTEEILRECIGRPVEVIQSNKEFTEEDVTDQMVNGSFSLGSSECQPFDFPGLRSDIEAIERNFFGSMNKFFESAEEIKNGFFGVLRDPRMFDGESSSFPSMRRGMPSEDHSPGVFPKPNEPNSGHVDLSGLARDV